MYYPADPYEFLWNHHFERKEDEEDETKQTENDREEFD